jgi:molybdate transport system permease protein
MTIDWQPLWLTVRLASATTAVLLLLGIPLAYRMAYSRSRFKPVMEALVSLPLVLPPSVLGFYLLLAFSPRNRPGAWLARWFDVHLAFSFGGLLLASVLFSLPFMVQPLQAGFAQLPRALLEASRTLGKPDRVTLVRVLLPNMKAALLTATVLSFAHTVGEFGVVMMIGGNIPGVTRVASIAIYDQVESLDFAAAHVYSAVLLALSFATLLAVYVVNRRWSGDAA